MIFRNSTIAISVISLFAVALLALLGWSFYSVAAEYREVNNLLVEAGEGALEEEALQTLKGLQISAKEDLDAFDEAVFSQDKLVLALESLERAGRSLGLVVQIVSVDEVSSGEGRNQGVMMTVEARGSWRGTSSFLEAVESLPYRVVVDEVSFSKEESAWKLNLRLFLPSFD